MWKQNKCKNKGSDIVSISEPFGGGEGGIWTLATVNPSYSLSRGAPSASWVLLHIHLAEREGFEPPVPFDITGFQDQRLQPLGHLSLNQTSDCYYSGSFRICQYRKASFEKKLIRVNSQSRCHRSSKKMRLHWERKRSSIWCGKEAPQNAKWKACK